MQKTKFLSTDYFRTVRGLGSQLPELPGADVRVQYLVTDVPGRGEVRYALCFADGRLAEMPEGTIDDPCLRITMGYDVSVKIHRSELKPPEAAAEGHVTVSGDTSKLPTMMSIVSRPEYEAMVKKIAELTEF
ncbi:hypothetical protein DVA86_03330 [Streptomyces armeniacus]|uniref:SCP2 domain-containing protein n=1 Tax=Streptomyces armeniacus TaxID=83291 RepID=A0A345XJK5_9ACTN|nr:hypothetical protein [Streptomyces armeniacus]AXK31821.1 hypothetical protein DVA86_03330 [Streptomyces armeniacus]